jgi:hypothetical protein
MELHHNNSFKPAAEQHLWAFVSCTYVNELRPSLWGRRHCPQFLNCAVERIRHSIRIDRFAGQELLVDPLRHVWSIGITNGPVSLVSVAGYAAPL